MNNQKKKSREKTVIRIRRGDEYRSRVACIYQKDAFFYQAYLQAGQCVAEILNATNQYYTPPSVLKDPCDGLDSIQLSDFSRLVSYSNNIIAFCGERGGGKTSAMISFAKGLEFFHLKMQNNDNQAIDFWEKSGLDPNELRQYRFIVLDPIDPTSMEQTDSILRIVLSRLFDKLQKYHTESHNGRRLSYTTPAQESTQNALQTDFQKCFRALDTLKEKRNEDFCYDDLDYLAELNDSSTLKQKMLQLVEDLCYLLSGEYSKCFLVIQIDDADLNALHAFKIMEDIRKYMVLPKVVVLMSTELHQLEMIAEQHYVDEFRALIDCTASLVIKDTLPDRLDCHSSAERYINKLLPSIHQIHLPELNHSLKYATTDICLSYLSNGEDQFPGNPDWQEALLKLLYRKTRIILLKPLYEKHNFLPSTIRMLTHFLTFFYRLHDIPEKFSFRDLYGINPSDKEDPELTEAQHWCIQNLEQVERYFRQIWCHLHLTTKELLEMEKLFAVPFLEMHQQTTLLIQALERKASAPAANNGWQPYTYTEIFTKLRELRKSHDGGQMDIKFAVEFHYTLSMHRWLIAYNHSNQPNNSFDPLPQINELLKFVNYDPVDVKSIDLPTKYEDFFYKNFNFKHDPVPLSRFDNFLNDLVIKKSCIVRGTDGRVIKNSVGDPYHFESITYSLSTLLSSDYMELDERNQPETSYTDPVSLSHIQFAINTDIQNLFFELLTRFDPAIPNYPKDLDFCGVLTSFLEIFNKELAHRGCPLSWNENPFSHADLKFLQSFFDNISSTKMTENARNETETKPS